MPYEKEEDERSEINRDRLWRGGGMMILLILGQHMVVTIRVMDEFTGKEKILFHEQLYKAGDQLNHLLSLKVKILAPHTDYHVNILLMKRFCRS